MSQYQQLLELRASKVTKLEAQVKTRDDPKILPHLFGFETQILPLIFSASGLCTWHKYFQPLGTRPLGDRQCDWINYNGYNSDVMMLVKLKVIAVMRVEGLNTS